MDKNPYRLEQDVLPVSYDIHLTLPMRDDYAYSGEETILLNLRKSTKKIILHSVDLNITQAVISRSGPEGIKDKEAKAWKINEEFGTVTFHFAHPIKAGKAKLHLHFNGKITDGMEGLYQVPYTGADGQKHIAAATQCEPTDCRRIFPCFDDPDKKAKFMLSLTIPKHLTAISNMPLWGIKDLPHALGYKKLDFLSTPPMSTYLFAFVVAELYSIWDNAKNKNQTHIRVFTTPGKKEHGRWTLEVALRTIPFFEKWSGVEYPLPKLDFCAFSKFAAGAMENWGLITGRDGAFLVNPAEITPAVKRNIAHYVNHESKHMWFGNIVTMEWWDDLWLNEAFASFMDHLATDHEFPEWKTWDIFTAEGYCDALYDDALTSTRPIEFPVWKPSDIEQAFDTIAYEKGASILRMIAFFLGEAFRQGVSQYLKDHAYGNAKTIDLWKALEDASGHPVREIMSCFTRQPGYPLIRIYAERDKNGFTNLEFAQSRFFIDGKKDQGNAHWNIPLNILALNSDRQEIHAQDLMGHHAYATTLPVRYDELKWVKLNAGQTGFYRTAYSPELFSRLTNALKSGEIENASDRIGLINDTLALARAGIYPTGYLLELLEACSDEREHAVWIAIKRALYEAGDAIHILGPEMIFNKFSQKILMRAFERLGWNKKSGETDAEITLRPLIIEALGHFWRQDIIREADERFKKMDEGNIIEPDIRWAVYVTVASYGGENELDKFIAIFKNTADDQEKLRVRNTMAGFHDSAAIKKVLEFIMSDDILPSDAPRMLEQMGSYPKPCMFAWNFVRTNWEALISRFHKHGGKLFPRALERVVGSLCRDQIIQEAEKFMEEHPLAGGERAVARALEKAHANSAWHEHAGPELTEWLEDWESRNSNPQDAI